MRAWWRPSTARAGTPRRGSAGRGPTAWFRPRPERVWADIHAQPGRSQRAVVSVSPGIKSALGCPAKWGRKMWGSKPAAEPAKADEQQPQRLKDALRKARIDSAERT